MVPLPPRPWSSRSTAWQHITPPHPPLAPHSSCLPPPVLSSSTPPVSPQRLPPPHAVAASASSSPRSCASSSRPACCVCRVSSDEPLLHCARCSLDVHAPCCGVDASSAPSEWWQCRRCASGVPPNSVACFVCGQRSGCFSPTDDPTHPWVHILCGVWMPYLSWHNPDAMDKLANVQSIELTIFLCRPSYCTLSCFL